MTMQTTRRAGLTSALVVAWILEVPLPVAKAAGVTDSEIRIGHIMPSTGPLTAFAAIGRAEAAYF
ncbi:hypothetical protein, partial [Acinetobacter baumannii]|uniref:hypothetical protein n=1 Tax=Acinetobacter baumannii TaxID=470 RepID=UPI001BB46EDD